MVPFNGMYEALKARQFDGQSDPIGVVLSLKLYEVQTYLESDRALVVGVRIARQCSCLERLAARRSVRSSNAMPRNSHCCSATTSNRSTLLVPRCSCAAECNSTPPIATSFRARLGDFYKSWRAKAGPEMWRLLEFYAGDIGR